MFHLCDINTHFSMESESHTYMQCNYWSLFRSIYILCTIYILSHYYI